ncbi:MAG TPA: MBL fold metallo-hydrolase [Blastocatellia bacterium]|nr:MBL fold metallo-hydrolase [Blastocatellia bacterium]
MIIETFPVGLLQCNCTILGSAQTREAIVIDPGDEVQKILARLKAHRLEAKYIIATHAHIDHVGGFSELRAATGAPVYLHEGDQFLYDILPIQAQMIGLATPPSTQIDHYLSQGDELGAGEIRIKVHHTPGHTPGSLCFHLPDNEAKLFSGDTLFMRGIGRTDLWGGSFEQIMDSLHHRVLALPDETVVIPGHGPITTIGDERAHNPWLQRQ